MICSMNKKLSDIFRWIRFPLAVMIVMKHYYTPDILAEYFCGLTGSDYTIYYIIMWVSSSVMSSLP